MKRGIRYWQKETIKAQSEHIEHLKFLLDLERDLRVRWETLYKESVDEKK